MQQGHSRPRLGVLANEESWYYRDLARAAEGVADIGRIDFGRLRARTIGPTEGLFAEQPLSKRFDAMVVRTMPLGSLEQVVFRMDALARLEEQGTLFVNPPKAMELAIDKYLSLSRLVGQGYRVPETHVCQTWQDAMESYELLGPSVVVKPIFGGEGRGIMRIDDADLALRAFKTLQQLGQVIYQQTFIRHPGYDLRVLVLGERMWGMRRTAADSWRTNLSRGATASAAAIPAEIAELALAATKDLGLVMAGLDFLPDGEGGWYLLEANAVPGWKGLNAACDVDIAAELIAWISSQVALGEG